VQNKEFFKHCMVLFLILDNEGIFKVVIHETTSRGFTFETSSEKMPICSATSFAHDIDFIISHSLIHYNNKLAQVYNNKK